VDRAASIAAIHLTIADLPRSLRFYQERLGLRLHRQDEGSAVLGAGGHDWLFLTESASAPRAHRTTGLYHFAILVPSRADLARALRRLVETRTMMQGFADHAVSEAIYLADPDGNGIEIYRDRPRADWPWLNGALQMGSEPLDVEKLLAEARPAGGDYRIPKGTFIGHMHLHVSDLDEAERFYRDALGFDLIMRYGHSAAFLSAGGYHHHVAVNTWAGVGAPPPPPGAIGLRHFAIHVSDKAALANVEASIRRAGLAPDVSEGRVAVADPAGNHVSVEIGV